MAIAYVNSTSVYGSTALTLNGVTNGNLLVAFCSSSATLAGTSLSDDKSNTWTALTNWNANLPGYMRVYYSKNVTGGNVQVSITSPNGDFGWSLHEYSGIDTSSPFDAENRENSTSDNTWGTGSVSTSQASCLLFTAWANEYGDNYNSVDTNWTVRTAETSHCHRTFDRIVTTQGTYECTGTTKVGGVNDGGVIVSFKGSSGGATGENIYINVDDAHKQVAAAYVNVDDAWKEVTDIYVNVDDAWKTV